MQIIEREGKNTNCKKGDQTRNLPSNQVMIYKIIISRIFSHFTHDTEGDYGCQTRTLISDYPYHSN